MRDVVILIVPVLLKVALEVDVDGELGLGYQPYGAAGEPVVGELCLPAVLQLLLEDTVLIADRIAHCGEAHGSKTVKVAGSKSSQTAVAQTCVGLVFVYLIEIDVILLQHRLYAVSKLEIVDACFEGASHEELH